MTTCLVDSCTTTSREAGYCWPHWARWAAFGDPLATRRFYRHSDRIRVMAKIDERPDGCWRWTGRLDEEGYGQIRFDGANIKAHRAVYRLLIGPINAETLDHLCRNRACVNPVHLEPVSMRDNTMRGETIAAANAAKESCPSGHQYSPENTYVTPKGDRRCRACTREHIRRSKAKKRASMRR